MESSFPKIEHLRADNWVPWKIRINAILRDKDLLDVVNGSCKKPTIGDLKAPTSAETAKIGKWEKSDAKACTIIELAVGDLEIVHIVGRLTACEMWQSLSMVHEAKGRATVLSA